MHQKIDNNNFAFIRFEDENTCKPWHFHTWFIHGTKLWTTTKVGTAHWPYQ